MPELLINEIAANTVPICRLSTETLDGSIQLRQGQEKDRLLPYLNIVSENRIRVGDWLRIEKKKQVKVEEIMGFRGSDVQIRIGIYDTSKGALIDNKRVFISANDIVLPFHLYWRYFKSTMLCLSSDVD